LLRESAALPAPEQAMSQRNLLLLLAALLVAYACYVRAEQNPYARYISDGFSIIDRWALEEAPDQELFNAALNGMVDVLHKHGDAHTEFIDAERQSAYREEYVQEFGGVGIRLRLLGNPPLPTVIGLPEAGTPAAEADIHLADRIQAVDGRSTAGLELDDVTRMIRGPVERPVTLTMLSPSGEKSRDVTIERMIVTVESVLGDVHLPNGQWNYRLRDSPRLAYVRVIKFGDKTAAELAKVLAELKRDGLDGLILDMRDDAGGVLDGAVEVSDLFLPAGKPIVTTRGRDKKVRDRFMSSGAGGYSDLPLVVIVDRNTASASEIVAACLQDYGRAAVVGERSYGKGTVQRLIGVESGRSLLKLTSATYWRPSGKNIHRMPGDGEDAEWGVTPNEGLDVKLARGEYGVWRDYRVRRDLIGDDVNSELAAALDLADGKIPSGFKDRPLERAVEYLEKIIKPQKLSGPPS
jgi:carboxyl-terminal processing protease